MSFNAIRENKILAKISESTVCVYKYVSMNIRKCCLVIGLAGAKKAINSHIPMLSKMSLHMLRLHVETVCLRAHLK